MEIIKKIFFNTSATARDIREVFDRPFLDSGYKASFFFEGSQKHIKYSKDSIEFDFWWVNGSRPVLFLKKDDVFIKTDIYEKLVKNHAPRNASIGQVSFFINSKLDRDKYYEEHRNFVSEYLNAH